MGGVNSVVRQQSVCFLDASSKTNHKELLRTAYYDTKKVNDDVFNEIKDHIDLTPELQEVFLKNELKFPNAPSEMDSFIEGLSAENAEIIYNLLKSEISQ
jgi:hypothetical protein